MWRKIKLIWFEICDKYSQTPLPKNLSKGSFSTPGYKDVEYQGNFYEISHLIHFFQNKSILPNKFLQCFNGFKIKINTAKLNSLFKKLFLQLNVLFSFFGNFFLKVGRSSLSKNLNIRVGKKILNKLEFSTFWSRSPVLPPKSQNII